MVLGHATWQEVRDLDRDTVALLPTGSCEQHGPHLPLLTDTLLVSAVASEVEKALQNDVLLLPAVWLGASSHHMAFDGSMDGSEAAYEGSVRATLACLATHGFHRTFVLNGHGGNTSYNDSACRRHKAAHPGHVVGHSGYFAWIGASLLEQTLEGPVKTIRHACEAETSLMLHLHPDLVRMDRARDDGLATVPPIPGLVWHFDECTEEGSHGYATLATAEKGRALFEASVAGVTAAMKAIRQGVALFPAEH